MEDPPLLDEIIHHAEYIVPAIANALPEQSETITNFVENLQEKKPQIAKGLLAASMICSTVGGIPGAQPLLLIGIILAGAATVLDPEARDDNFEINKKLRGISNKLKSIEEKTDKILDLLTELVHGNKLKNIRTRFRLMTRSTCITMWADQFHYDISNFQDNLGDFDPENLFKLFSHIYETKCDDNLDELKEIHEYVTTTRIMYLQITSAYYTNTTKIISKEEKESGLFEEMEKFSKDMVDISESMSSVCPFFHAAITLEREHLFHAAFIPEVPQQPENKLCDKISWKNEKKVNEDENGSMYYQNPDKGYAVSVPKKKQSKFGKSLTSRYRKSASWSGNCYIIAGSARMEKDEKIVIGELNEEATWINGNIEIDKDTGIIYYRKYDEKGNFVKNSKQEFYDFKWSKSSKGKRAQRSVSNVSTMPTPKRSKKIKTQRRNTVHNERQEKHDKQNVFNSIIEDQTPTSDSSGSTSYNIAGGTVTVTKKSNGATSSTTTTSQLTGSAADSILKNLGINLEDLGIGGSSNRTITVTKKTSTVESTRKNNATEKKKLVTKRKEPAAEMKKPAAEKKKAATEKKKPAAEKKKDATSINSQLTDSATDSLLKNLGIDLEKLGINGSSGRTITVIKKTSTVDSASEILDQTKKDKAEGKNRNTKNKKNKKVPLKIIQEDHADENDNEEDEEDEEEEEDEEDEEGDEEDQEDQDEESDEEDEEDQDEEESDEEEEEEEEESDEEDEETEEEDSEEEEDEKKNFN